MNLEKYIEIDNIKNNKFVQYMNLLLEWNQNINLTTITKEDDIELKHFADSLTITKYIEDNKKIIDIGTGAGFPGIPLKIYNESLNITLLDSLNKRISFLNNVIEQLELKKIEAVHGRAEDLARKKEYREKYDIAVSRAVANLSTLLEYAMPFIKVNGIFICMKGPNIEAELSNAKNALSKLGGKIDKIDSFKLYNTDNLRNIIIIRKIKNTDIKYPRKAGIPTKQPL